MLRPALVAALLAAIAAAQPPPEPPIDPNGLAGARVIAGGGRLPSELRATFVQLAGGAKGNVLLVPTAGKEVDDQEAQERIAASWRRDFPQTTFTVVHTRDRAVADSEDFCAPLQRATGVWFGGGVQKRIADAYVGTRFQRELLALCRRGGVVGGTSAGAAIQSRRMIQEGRDPPIVSQGFDLVPDAIVDMHFTQRQRLPRLLTALQANTGRFGIGVDESTAVVVEGRSVRVVGEGTATLALGAWGDRPARTEVLRPGDAADLVTWQRAARGRTGPIWPPSPMAEPRVPKGALVLVGGGHLPNDAVARFVELAGGKDAHIVVVPSAMPAAARREPADDPFVRLLRDAGVADVRTFDAATPADVTAEKLEVLRDATGIWFGGGRQWRLCDAFDGTPAIAAFHAVLARGGAIGGSSAGATIQAEFLVRGNPLGNAQEWCEGYDRGFAFLPGCAVDQHFLVRHREDDLRGLVAQLPQLIGLGIDEGTAAIVQGSVLEVVGGSSVAVFDVRRADAEARSKPQPTLLAPGSRWDLAAGAPAK